LVFTHPAALDPFAIVMIPLSVISFTVIAFVAVLEVYRCLKERDERREETARLLGPCCAPPPDVAIQTITLAAGDRRSGACIHKPR